MKQASEISGTNLHPVEEDDATGTVARVYAEYRERFGRQHVPGILKCFATHPPLLEQMMALASTLLFTDGHLTRATKEMLATYVSRLNACPYCIGQSRILSARAGRDRRVAARALRPEAG